MQLGVQVAGAPSGWVAGLGPASKGAGLLGRLLSGAMCQAPLVPWHSLLTMALPCTFRAAEPEQQLRAHRGGGGTAGAARLQAGLPGGHRLLGQMQQWLAITRFM